MAGGGQRRLKIYQALQGAQSLLQKKAETLQPSRQTRAVAVCGMRSEISATASFCACREPSYRGDDLIAGQPTFALPRCGGTFSAFEVEIQIS